MSKRQWKMVAFSLLILALAGLAACAAPSTPVPPTAVPATSAPPAATAVPPTSAPAATATSAPKAQPSATTAAQPTQAPTAAAAQKPTGELRIAMPSLYTETLHPYWGPSSRKFYYEVLYDYLIGLDEKGEFDPNQSIATKWEEAPDHLSWTFTIREGVKFHDGSPLTLEDVKYSLDTILDPKNVSARSIAAPKQASVEIVQPNKIVMRLKEPWTVALTYLSSEGQGGGNILPKKYIEEVGGKFEKAPIGTGPYKYVEQKEGDYIKFEALDSHWRVGTPKYKTLIFKTIPNDETRVAALQSGQVDIALVGVVAADKLANAGFTVQKKVGGVDMNLEFLRTYQEGSPLAKKEVRQALTLAIDKASILKNIMKGQGKTIGYTVAMFSWSYSLKDYPVTPYDPAKAKQLLAQAGYPNGFTMTYYKYATSIPEQKIIGDAIAGFWEAIGVKVNISELDYGAFSSIWMKKSEPPGPAAFTHSWSSRRTETWRSLYGSDVKTYYFSQTSDPEMDKLINAYEKVTSMEALITAERNAEDYVLANYYKTGLLSADILFATGKGVPQWGMGKGLESYRFEYVGAKK